MTEGQQGSPETAAETGTGVRLDAADLELIEKFLSDRLDPRVRDIVETRIVGDPAFRREVELNEAMRQGVHELARQGAIDALLASQSAFWNRQPIAVGASVVAGLFAATSILLYTRLYQTQEEIHAAATIAPTVARETLRFELTRSAAGTADLTWRRPAVPTLLELRFDVGLEQALGYTLMIERLGPDVEATVLSVPHVGIDTDGLVTMIVHSALLEPGDFQLRLQARTNAASKSHTFTYSLRVTD